MIIVPLLIIVIIFIVRFQKGMFAALLVIVATKSLLDAFWEYRLGPLSFSSFSGIMIPMIFFPLFKRKKVFPKFWKIRSYWLVAALSFGLFWALPIKPFETVENSVIVLNVFLAFYLIPYMVNSPERLNKFLLAIIIGGLFPILVSMFQFQTGIIFQERQTVGLTRYVGFYHDAFPVRFYGLFSLFSVITYFLIFKPRRKIVRFALILTALGSLFSIYLVFSKAATAILGLWIILILLTTRSKLKVLFSVIIGVAVVTLLFGDIVSSNIEQLFSKEVGYQSGEIKDARFTLAGRGYVWEDYWTFWSVEQSTFFQWFGDGIGRPAHNEFFRILLVNGIIGLVFFMIYLFSMIKLIFKVHKKVMVFCLMLFGMYLIDCIGLDTGNYYYYNILLWGFIGLFTTRNTYIFK